MGGEGITTALEPLLRLGNDSTDPPTLIQFRPAWREQAYLRFSGIAYRLENNRFDSWNSGLLPTIFDGHFQLHSEDIVTHLSRRRCCLDANLNAEQVANCKAYCTMVTEVLDPLLSVLRWAASESDVEQTVLAPLRKCLLGPFKYISPYMEKRRALATSTERGLDSLSHDQMVAKTREYYNALDTMLGCAGTDFFFGNSPTSLDALVFGHMADALTTLSLSPVLPVYRHLMNHFRRVASRYFQSEGSSSFESTATVFGNGTLGPKELEILMASFARANYVNSQNTFYQLRQCVVLCAQEDVPQVPDPFTPKILPVPKMVPYTHESTPATEDLNAEDGEGLTRGNLAFLGTVALAVFGFLAANSLAFLRTEEIYVVEEDEE